MRKVMLLIAVLCIAAPAMAASNVTITASDDDVNCITIAYESDGNLIRAFALDIELDDPNVPIIKVKVEETDYRIYPSQIEIDNGEVIAYNTPYAPDDLNDANLGIEMGSLYTTDTNYAGDANAGYNLIPPADGNLLKIYVDANLIGSDGDGNDVNYTVTLNTISGGVVMEDPEESANVVINLDDGVIDLDAQQECMAPTNPQYAEWLAAGSPKCWCYEHQCNGDADGEQQFGAFWVLSNDLPIFIGAYGKNDASLPPGGECANFDHLKQFGSFQVLSDDLTILVQWYGNNSVPSCGTPPDANYIYWETP